MNKQSERPSATIQERSLPLMVLVSAGLVEFTVRSLNPSSHVFAKSADHKAHQPN